jgi:hypothetical protein
MEGTNKDAFKREGAKKEPKLLSKRTSTCSTPSPH